MSHLIDTDIVIGGIKGHEPAATFISTEVEAGVYISVITYGEVLEGLLHRVHGSQAQRERFHTFIESFDRLHVGPDEVQQYARIRFDLRSRGQLIPDNDLWIAATALANDLTLVSRDQHFGRITDLRLYDPEDP